MIKPAQPMFLERRLYRRRRVMDAARLLPVLGLLLFLLPLLWAAPSEEGSSIVRSMIYLFVTWAVLIAISAILSRWLTEAETGQDTEARAKAGNASE